MEEAQLISFLNRFLWPLFRLVSGLACGLLLANLLEALRWTDQLARLAQPLARAAHLGRISASAFALGFVSPSAANALLSEHYQAGSLSARELMLANLFNGLPAWLAHLPTILLLTWPVLGIAAIYYTGVTFFAAIMRTLFTAGAGRVLLPVPVTEPCISTYGEKERFPARLTCAFKKALARFRKRFPRLVLVTAAVYALMWYGQETGFFRNLEAWLAANLEWLAVVKPQAMGIIVLQLLAEMGATLGAAGAALQDASLTPADVVVAMLIGNIISTPLRAIRHQLPAYAGFYRPMLALRLVLANQTLRLLSMVVAVACYILLF